MNNILLTPLVKKLLLLNIAVFILDLFVSSIGELFSLYHPHNVHFYPFQFFTYMFLHANPMHLIFNSLPLIFLGPLLETFLGEKRFLFLYIVCGIGAALIHTGIYHIELTREVERLSLELPPRAHWDRINNSTGCMVGASGAIFGMLMACLMYFPEKELRIFFLPFPIKIKYIVPLYALCELFMGIEKIENDNVAHFAHLGGMVFAYLIIKYWRTYP